MPIPMAAIYTSRMMTSIRVQTEPALNIIHTMLQLSRCGYTEDNDDWAIRTKLSMTDEERWTNDVVIVGLYYAVIPAQSWSSFPAYLDYLASVDPVTLREKMLETYLDMLAQGPKGQDGHAPDVKKALESPENYVSFLQGIFNEDHVFPEIEHEAYRYVINPPAMKELVISHLRQMWQKYLASEWERERPILEQAVRVVEATDFSKMSRLDATRLITGLEFTDDPCKQQIDTARRVIFVPSMHMGPYLGRFFSQGTLWVLYQARLPQGAELEDTDLGRAEIIMRLNALADDSRLRILRYIEEHGEVKAQTVIQALDLSQSAASRHLTQLSAMGYLAERRCDGAKCYSLNRTQIHETLQAISGFLLK